MGERILSPNLDSIIKSCFISLSAITEIGIMEEYVFGLELQVQIHFLLQR